MTQTVYLSGSPDLEICFQYDDATDVITGFTVEGFSVKTVSILTENRSEATALITSTDRQVTNYPLVLADATMGVDIEDPEGEYRPQVSFNVAIR